MVDKKMRDNAKLSAWRITLGKIVSDPQERRRIAHMIGINHVTLTRWSTHISTPRMDSLHRMVQAIPTHRQQFLDLIPEEFPDFLTKDAPKAGSIVQEIPSAFYEQVIQAYTSNQPLLRCSSIRVTIIQQIVSQLDPALAGIAASISVCVPPHQDGGVRSLREYIGRGTAPWHSHLENRLGFLGIESPQGYAIAQGRSIVMQSHEEKVIHYPGHHVAWEKSAIACPLIQAGNVAGCLYISSPQKDFFEETLTSIAQSYANLLTLGFLPHEFYNLKQITLGIMPPNVVQQPHLQKFQPRVSQRMRELQKCKPVSRSDAETSVLQDMEEELLHLSY